MKRLLLLLFSTLIVLILVACSSAKNQDNPTEYPGPAGQGSQTTLSNQTYPYPGAGDPSQLSGSPMYPYPMPNSAPKSNEPTLDYNAMPYIPPNVEATSTATPSVPIVIPTPRPDLGIVVGKLLASDPGNPPYLSVLHLGNTIKADRADFPPMVSLSPDTDPKAVQDITGAFMFTDIKPGFYAVIVWNPYNSIVIQDEKKENYLVFEVKPGEITDLGTILFP